MARHGSQRTSWVVIFHGRRESKRVILEGEKESGAKGKRMREREGKSMRERDGGSHF